MSQLETMDNPPLTMKKNYLDKVLRIQAIRSRQLIKRDIKMKITKRQLKRIIREEKSRLLSERNSTTTERFRDIMVEIAELVDEAFDLANRPEAARGYWYNGILARVDLGTHGMANKSYSMADTLEEMGGGDEDDMMERGYLDGLNNVEPQYPDNQYYMVNYEDGKLDAR